MTAEVRWLDRIIENPPVADTHRVAEVERALGATLPADFLSVATVHQGAMPMPRRLELDGVATAIEHLYHFEAEPAPYSLVNAQADAAGVLPRGAVVFASALGGSVLAFDYRNDPSAPSVIVALHDHYPPICAVANSFTAMLGQLVESPRRPTGRP